ncbi:MAG: hypothetical protein CUN49_08550 [Candidatus Thermofonsia Clade 1 bacterium]|uniref:Uncharacterized protein n=1 Tax=Candidatus Thermofonsia Clade 1 bacterium TaxID=2364210 RepID=A0A2M8PE54_9CHLR|nr:MAG: hypothetical protein CUN49_08550 [Candidatus Thermofonsia Clade 1 bacterium]
MTVYNGKVAVWYVHGRTVAEDTIDQIISVLKEFAPAVEAVWVKIGEANEWMGNIGRGDPKPDLAIRGVADIDRWVAKLAAADLEFHAWYIPKGINPIAEADLAIQACSRPGVRSLILDVEPFTGYWVGGRANVRPFMTRLRAGLPADFHIGMSVDPRPWHYNSIFPQEWRPYINSIHPQTYWADFNQTPDAALQMVYNTWGNYGLPIIPVLQGYQGSGNRLTRADMDRARVVATVTYKAPGLSWFRFGTLNRTWYPAVNVKMTGEVPIGIGDRPTDGRYGAEIIVKPNEIGYAEGTYDGSPNPLQSFQNEEGWTSRYIATNNAYSRVWVRWAPRLPASGWYEIAAYVPSQHGSTRNARYKINGILGQQADFEVRVSQIAVDSLWVSLGVYQFDASHPNAGVVFLNDLTGERGREIAFDAIRWRQVLGWNRPPRYLADGFDSPVGLPQERQARGGSTWPETWLSTNPYKSRYALLGKPTIHTGDDLILQRGSTLGQPVHAVASGVVTHAGRLAGSWGDVIVIQHDPLISNGQVVYSRYGHVGELLVRAGDRVVRGQRIAVISDAYGLFRSAPHLHFDISPTRILENSPGDWPGLDMTRIERDYADPRLFIYGNRPAKP